MTVMPEFPAADEGISHLFASQAAREGGSIRRKGRDFERHFGRAPFPDEMKRRGFPVVKTLGSS